MPRLRIPSAEEIFIASSTVGTHPIRGSNHPLLPDNGNAYLPASSALFLWFSIDYLSLDKMSSAQTIFSSVLITNINRFMSATQLVSSHYSQAVLSFCFVSWCHSIQRYRRCASQLSSGEKLFLTLHFLLSKMAVDRSFLSESAPLLRCIIKREILFLVDR